MTTHDTRPEVSIIIPVYNRRALVREAIASALGASPDARREVIVVDDCSTDGTWDEIQAFGSSVRALRLPRNSGQAVARNSGLDAARGAFIKFLDSDDILIEDQLEREISAAHSTGADIVVSGWGTVYPDGRRVETKAPRFHSIVDDILAGRAVTSSAALYRRGKTARWDPEIPKLADWDFFVQSALGASAIVTLERIGFWIREHEGNRVSRTTMLVNARSHYVILRKIEDRLESEGKLTEPRRLRLAQYLYKELRVLSLYDRASFEREIEHIFELDPHFTPRDEESQRWMRVAARVLGTRRAILLHSTLKRALSPSRSE